MNILKSILNGIFINDVDNVLTIKNVTFAANFGNKEVAFPLTGYVKKLIRSLLHWTLLILLMLYVWNQTHFQIGQYSPDFWRLVIKTSMESSVVIMFALGCVYLGDRRLVGFALMLVAIVLFYGFLNFFLVGNFPLSSIKASLISVALLPIICNPRNLKQFLLLNYWLGILLIIFSSVPLLHFMGLFDIPYESIARVGGDPGRPDLDPLSFGIFGRTESYAHSGFPRLQGWSSEPLHWSYFIFWTFTCWLLTFPRFGSPAKIAVYWISLIFILIQLWGVHSTSALISGALVLVTSLALFYLRRRCESLNISLWIFIISIAVPGLLLPFALSLVDGASNFLLNQNLFPEGVNWRGKIDFLKLGATIFTHFAPNSESIPVSHNLILEYYLRYGYLLILPLVLQIFLFINMTSRACFYFGALAPIVVAIANTLLIPGALFLPSGVMFQLLVMASITHNSQRDSE